MANIVVAAASAIVNPNACTDAHTSAGRRPYLKAVLMAHNRAGRDIPNTTTIHHGKLPTNADGIHFNTEGQLKLGEMTAAAIAECYKAKQ